MSPSALRLHALFRADLQWYSAAHIYLKWQDTAHQQNDYPSLLMTLNDNTTAG